MSIENLKKLTSEFANCNFSVFNLSKKPLEKLVIELSDCVVELHKQLNPTTQEREEEESWMSLMEFYDKTHLCHPSTLAKLMATNHDFFYACGMRKGKRYFIKMKTALRCLSALKTFKYHKKAYDILMMEENSFTKKYNSDTSGQYTTGPWE